ncbi:hypothetical protein MHK_002434 [Candidatus Magnetomorum sp. HK-1]|nr:hypothetical protein MHK_002434 [Candidatus Magnetomorum sp. HK-1]
MGGTPQIAEAILAKIQSSDIFVWDATLVYSQPRPSPNPNVLIELGYALAVMGEGRLIGVMNTANKLGGEALPFDLKHRRWPISYLLAESSLLKKLIEKLSPKYDNFNVRRKETREKLVNNFEN